MNQTVITFTEPLAPPPIWPAIATGAVILVMAATLAWWRARSTQRPPRRRVRIFVSAMMGGASAMVLLTVWAASQPGVGEWDWRPYRGSADLIMAFRLLGYVLLAALLIGTGDLLFDALRPRRSPLWLVAGAPLFATFIVATLYATGSVGPFIASPTIEQATLVVAALAASLIWWAWLPTPHEEVTGIFE